MVTRPRAISQHRPRRRTSLSTTAVTLHTSLTLGTVPLPPTLDRIRPATVQVLHTHLKDTVTSSRHRLRMAMDTLSLLRLTVMEEGHPANTGAVHSRTTIPLSIQGSSITDTNF